MKQSYRIAVLLTALMTVVTAILRITCMPGLMNTRTGAFGTSYVCIALMSLTAAACLILCGRKRIALPSVGGKLLKPVSLIALLTGSLIVIYTALDACQLLFLKRVPLPLQTTIGNLTIVEKVVLGGMLVCGVLAGMFFIRLGLSWLSAGESVRGVMALHALCPALWMWFRLAAYETSYLSAANLSRRFYDVAMFCFALLFLLGFARYVSGVQEKPSRMFMGSALACALFSLTGPVVRIAMYMLRQTAAYEACCQSGPLDFAIGLFALLLACGMAWGKPAPVVLTAAPTAGKVPADPAAAPSAEELDNSDPA